MPKWIRLFMALVMTPVLGADGLEIKKYRARSGANVRVVYVDSHKFRLKLVVDPDRRLKTLAELIDGDEDILAAINGGFFLKSGQPAGFFKYHDWWSYGKKQRGVIGFSGKGAGQSIYFDRLTRRGQQITSPWQQGQWWAQVAFVLEGAPLLIRNGQRIDMTSEQILPSFIRNRYARSGICMDDQQRILLVMVTGGDRRSHRLGYVKGLSLPEFAEALQNLGCQQALNLDGGYSSSLFYQGKVTPGHWAQGIRARPIANAIAVVASRSGAVNQLQ